MEIWLNAPPRIGRLFSSTSHHLGRATTADDAEDAWGTFCVEGLDATIDLYDARAPFEAFLLLRLGGLLERRGAESESVELSRSSATRRTGPRANWCSSIRTQTRSGNSWTISAFSGVCPRCLQIIWRWLSDTTFEGQTVSDIAAELGLSRGNVKVRLCRGRQWLSQCLEPA